METRYHIGLLTGTLLILAILSYAYYADYNYRKEIENNACRFHDGQRRGIDKSSFLQ